MLQAQQNPFFTKKGREQGEGSPFFPPRIGEGLLLATMRGGLFFQKAAPVVKNDGVF